MHDLYVPATDEPVARVGSTHRIRTHYRAATDIDGAAVLVTDITTERKEAYSIDYSASDIHAAAANRFVRGMVGTLVLRGTHATGDLYDFVEEVA